MYTNQLLGDAAMYYMSVIICCFNFSGEVGARGPPGSNGTPGSTGDKGFSGNPGGPGTPGSPG